VWSLPEGPAADLSWADGVDQAQLRSWLAQYLIDNDDVASVKRAHGDVGCVHLTVLVGRQDEVGGEGQDWVVTGFSHGPGPAPAHWPRVPLTDLIAFAIADLEAGSPTVERIS